MRQKQTYDPFKKINLCISLFQRAVTVKYTSQTLAWEKKQTLFEFTND